MCGRFLRHLLAEESRHSTPVGRLLLPVLVAFRFLLLVASGPGVFGDEQSEFVCNTQQPGCKTACFDAFHPLSPVRFWAFQVFLMAMPSALYLGFTLYHVIWHWEESGLNEKGEEESLIPDGDSNRDTSRTGGRRLLGAYVAHLVVRLVLEGLALGSQYYLYGFNVPISVSCRRDPCPFSITCNVSRPSEKTIFLKTMFGITVVCLSFTLVELVFVLLWKWRRTQKNKFSCNNFLIRASPKRHKEPTGDFPALETKE